MISRAEIFFLFSKISIYMYIYPEENIGKEYMMIKCVTLK